MEGFERLIGLTGMLLVFASFVVKRWTWLYTFNASGASLLAVYALLRGDVIFFTVEIGIVAFLLYRLKREIGVREDKQSDGCRS